METSGVKNVKFVCPSYKRAEIAARSIASLFPGKYDNFFLVVDRESKENYKKYFPESVLVVVPDEVEGLLARKRNWILDNLFEDTDDALVMFDDDVKALSFTSSYEWLTLEEIVGYVSFLVEFSEMIGAGLFGISNTVKKMPGAVVYKQCFELSGLISSEFVGFVDRSLRYDENLRIREDIALTVDNLLKHGVDVLSFIVSTRFVVSHGFGSGGDRQNAKKAILMQDVEYLLKKYRIGYGASLVRSLLKKNRYGGK